MLYNELTIQEKVRRAETYAYYLIHEDMTLREISKQFGVSKSCVFYYIREDLLGPEKYLEAKEAFRKHKGAHFRKDKRKKKGVK